MEYRHFVPVSPAGGRSPLDAAAIVFIVIVVIGVLYLGGAVLQPLALAALLSFVLAPVIRSMTKRGITKSLAVVIAVSLAVGLLVSLSVLMAQQLTNLASELPRYESNLREKIRTIKSYTLTSGALEKASDTLRDLQGELNKNDPPPSDQPMAMTPGKREPIPVEIQSPGGLGFDQFQSLVSPLLKPIAQTGLVILFMLFILLQREDLRDRMLRLGGTRDLQRSTVAMTDAGKRLSKFFLLQTGLNAGFGVVIAIGLWIIGVPNPLLWGVLAGLMRFVPFIGSIIAAIFPIALAAAVDPGWSMVIATALLFLIGEPLAGHVVEPLVYGKNTGLSPLAVVMATILWTLIWGPVGLLLATPLTLCLVVLGNYVPGLSILTVLFGDQPALSPSERLYQRMLVGDLAEAEELAEEHIEETSLIHYYETVAMPALRMAQLDATDREVPDDYLARLSSSVAELVEDLDDHPLDDEAKKRGAVPTTHGVTCFGVRGWVDDASAHIVAQVLDKNGFEATTLASTLGSSKSGRHLILDPAGNRLFCITAFGTNPASNYLRYVARRIRKQVPDAAIVACCWDVDEAALKDASGLAEIDAVSTTLQDAAAACRRLAKTLDAPEKVQQVPEPGH